MALSALARALGGTVENGDAPLCDVHLDSRRLERGALFCALPGHRADGLDHAGAAIERGATALLAPRAAAERARREARGLPLWLHDDPRSIAGRAAALVHGDPSRSLATYAVTGTNGKTTVAHLVGHFLAAAGRTPAVIGTVGNRIAGAARLPATNTTPDATELQRLCARHRAGGGDAFVMEASSHALAQERLDGFHVGTAIFTNLTRDHLDYHVDMARYEAAKARLFERLEPGCHAVLPAGDPVAERYAGIARARGASVHTYGIGSRADLSASRVVVTPGGIHTFLDGMGISWETTLPLVGRHNLANALAALLAVLVSGASPSALRGGLATVSLPVGRLERVDTNGRPFQVFVDFAHTPDAVEVTLRSLREQLEQAGRGRLICLFGCGGQKDTGKRPLMGALAERLADVVVLSSDNPRGEDPLAIIEQVRAGMTGRTETVVEPDRRAAIFAAVGLARPGDIVVLLGKGHEDFQEIAGVRRPFCDVDVAREAMA
jgi:UDP-N-acetylmuramoyl-L-alanyl-D-glutamate--2,6-diaminopimelate ligase